MPLPANQHGQYDNDEMRESSARVRQWMARRPRPADPDWNIHRLSSEFLEEEGQPLNFPRTVPADEADHMRNDDIVLGVAMNGVARAYPWWIMDNHHVGNDNLGGQPISLMLCEMCSSGIAFDPVVDGERHHFRLVAMYNGTVAFEDDETRSLWSPYFSMAIRGPRTGAKLSWLPVSQMSWANWRHLHPDTDVVAPEYGSREGHGSDDDIGSPSVQGDIMSIISNWDDRIPHNTLVLGVLLPGNETAYPIEFLRNQHGVVNATLAGQEVALFLYPEPDSYGALAFSRTCRQLVLTFEPGQEGPIDRETGSRWTYEGRAVDGPLTGKQLKFIPSHVAEWFIWVGHFPDMALGHEADV